MDENHHTVTALSPARLCVFLTSLTSRLLLVYLVLLIYASLYPWSGWYIPRPLHGWSFLLAPFPKYWTWSETIANIFVYIPLGALSYALIYQLYKPKRIFIVVASLAGGGLSLLIETMQMFIPYRVSSNVDLLMNTLGALIGAMISYRCFPYIFKRCLNNHSKVIFSKNAHWLIIFILLWLGIQISIETYLFSTGDVFSFLNWPNWLAIVGVYWIPSPWERMLFESFISSFSLLGVLALLCLTLEQCTARLIFAYSLLLCAILIKFAFSQWMYSSYTLTSWLSVGGMIGWMLILIAVPYVNRLSQSHILTLAVVSIAVQLMLINSVPRSSYLDKLDLNTGWLYLEPLSTGMAVVWPFLVLVVLIRRWWVATF